MKSTDMAVSLDKYLKYLAFSQHLAPLSISSYISDLLQLFQLKNHLKLEKWDIEPQFLLLKPLPELSTEEWAERVKESLRRRDLGRNSLKRNLCSLRKFITWAQSQGLQIPVVVNEQLSAHRKIPNYLSVDEVLILKNHIESLSTEDLKHRQQALLFALLYGSGLRVSEACHLKAGHIYWTRKEIHVTGKGSKERVAILTRYGLNLLKQNSHTFDDYIWGKAPLSQRVAYHSVVKLGAQAGLQKRLHPHMLRHSYGTHLINSGVNLRVIQSLLGHKSLAATEIYTHLEHQSLARSLESHHPLAQLPLKDPSANK